MITQTMLIAFVTCSKDLIAGPEMAFDRFTRWWHSLCLWVEM